VDGKNKSHKDYKMFEKAIKQEAKLRLAIAGPAGSGKTYTGLLIAQALANGGKIAVVDTEHGSASKYADLFDFDVMEMFPPFHPDRFVEAIHEAQNAGYSIIILDSLSHEWSGTGGILEVIDNIAARSNSKNTFAAWKQGTPLQNKLVDTIIGCNIHVIATMRTKQDYVIEPDERGKMTPKKIGLAPVQREGFEYEFDVVMNMDIDNTGFIVKTRCPALAGGIFKKPGNDIAFLLAEWLNGTPKSKDNLRQSGQEQPVAESSNGKDERIWTIAQRNILVSEKLADNDFAAKGMLGLSNLTQDATEAEILKWGKIYRKKRNEINPDTKKAFLAIQAAEYANNQI
jgi:AAA domain